MTNQSFDSNSFSPADDSDSGVEPIPIAQQVGQQSYLSNIQHQMEELLRASGVEVSDETASSALPLPSVNSPSAALPSPSPTSEPSSSGRVNKMDSFFAEAAAEKEAAEQAAAEQGAAEQAAAELAAAEQAAAEELETELAMDTPADPPHADTYDGTGPLPIAPPQEVPFQQESSSIDSSEAMQEQPPETPPAQSRPTGHAGLSAGLAAAGLGNLGARLAQESTSNYDGEFGTKEPQLDAESPSRPPTPSLPVIDPSFSGHPFDLEAARLAEVSGPVFSQEFDEKELSPEERLANRLKREKLVPADDQVADQPVDFLSPSPSVNAINGDEALADAQTQWAEPELDHDEPIADLFVEIPQVQQAPEVDQEAVDLQYDQEAVDREYDQEQPQEFKEHQEPNSIAESTTDSALLPPTPPEVNSPAAFHSQSPQISAASLLQQAQASDASVDPRLQKAKQLEEQFKQLQQQEGSYVEQAQQEQFEHERATVEDLGADEPADSQEEQRGVEQRSEEEKFAAIQQADRVKEARERASIVTRNAVLSISQSASTGGEENDDDTPEAMEQPGDVQPESSANLIQQAAPESGVPSTNPASPALSEYVSKRLNSENQFQSELFYAKMLEHLSDGIIFVDHKQRVIMWSRGAALATGIIPSVVLDRPLLPQTINLCDTNGNGLQLDKCPVAQSLRNLEIVTGEYKITNSAQQGGIKVELTVIPVIDENRYVNGAVVMFHDRTAQVNLQRQLKDLYEFSVLDPLTQVANRAEFERVQQEYVLAFQQSDNFNCSIIICDIDYFKSINDNFGHAVGDEALMSFAEMLKRYVRPQDLVARYGGEEFVILCADCDTAAAVQRAEQIRMALYKTPQPMLEGKSISASFGVSELREGDTAMDFFVRADTALLKAKETGRNRVVAGDGSLPTGADKPATELSETGILWNAQQRKNQSLICEEFKTTTPIQVLVEKLRGFIIENDALLQRVEPEFLSMEIQVEAPMDYSRKGAFTMNVEFKEMDSPIAGTVRTKSLNFIRVTIYAGRMRNWFSTNHTDLAPHLLSELRRFLMIGDKASRLSVDMATSDVRATSDVHN